jgi:outer membrane protein, multidrug efflux system
MQHLNKTWILIALILLAFLLALSACSVGPNYKQPDMKPPAQFSERQLATPPTTEAATRPTAPPDYVTWWKTLDDPELDSLVDRAVQGNPNLVAAEARIREARSNRGIVTSNFFPQINATGSYTNNRSSQNLPGFSEQSGGGFSVSGLRYDLWQAGFDMNWELDVFGGTRRALESANYAMQAAIFDKRDVLISLVAEVAANYIELRGEQRQLQIAMDNLHSQQQVLDLTRRKAEGGLVPYLDVAQQEAQVDSTASTIPTFQTGVRQSIHHIAILLGEPPEALSDELSAPSPIPVGPGAVPPGLPSDLLRRRPDVREAERQLAEATANIGVATADLFPQFSVTGLFGQASQHLKQIFDYNSQQNNIVPGVTWDIFDAGKVWSNVKVQDARQAEALEAYRTVVLQSFSDVDDSLVALNREQVRLQALRDAVTANQRAFDLSTELFQKGSADFLSVLDAQQSLFAAQTQQVESEALVSTDLVALYKALGGGWDEGKEKR